MEKQSVNFIINNSETYVHYLFRYKKLDIIKTNIKVKSIHLISLVH